VRYLSVCSGIEAASAAWHPLGWTPVAFSEVDKFPSAVLAHHYPDVPNWGDMTKFKEWPDADVDVLVGGTPCQSFSVAGLRKGMDDPRGNLALTYLAIADRYKPTFLCWENVPGVLSSNGGRDFGAILGGMVELGYGVAYRVLDAQFFGVPQRRRRVFVVGHLGDWRRAAAVLFEQHSLQGHPPPSRKARQTAPTIPSRRTAGGGLRTDFDCDGGLIPEPTIMSSGQANAEILEDGTGRGTPLIPVAFSSKDHGADAGDIAPTLRSMGHDGSHANGGGQVAIAFQANTNGDDGMEVDGISVTLKSERMPAVAFDLRGREGGAQFKGPHDTANIRAASGGSSRSYVAAMQVRRLTPMECERLQGFSDGYTLVPWRRGMSPDGPRYKALGNSMAVPCMRWLGERIQMVSDLEVTP